MSLTLANVYNSKAKLDVAIKYAQEEFPDKYGELLPFFVDANFRLKALREKIEEMERG